MVNASITAAQKLIDAKAYPPTHNYDVATLTPYHPLDERLDVLNDIYYGMFATDRFLDVGCSKGFFSLLAAKKSNMVVAIDPDQKSLDCWAGICPLNVTQQCIGFKEARGEFDMIWIGNGHHYLYREDKNWIEHLAELATFCVVIEGPTGLKCPEMRDFGAFQHEIEFLKAMDEHFTLNKRKPSPNYTPGRAVWLFFKTS